MTENQEEVSPDKSNRPRWIVDWWAKKWAEATAVRFWPNIFLASV
jgi:hypothetical protein